MKPILITLFLLLLIQPSYTNQKNTSNNSNQQQSTRDPPDIIDQIEWGTYKPWLYTAVTQGAYYPISVGLAYKSEAKQKEEDLRSFKENLKFRMDKNSKAQYSYHNGIDLAIQNIKDDENCVEIESTFLKEFKKNSTQQQWIYLLEGTEPENSNCNNKNKRKTPKRKRRGTFQPPVVEEDEEIKEFMDPSHFNTYFFYVSITDLRKDRLDNSEIRLINKTESTITLQIIDQSRNFSHGFMQLDIINEPQEVVQVEVGEDQENSNISNSSSLNMLEDSLRIKKIYNHTKANRFKQSLEEQRIDQLNEEYQILQKRINARKAKREREEALKNSENREEGGEGGESGESGESGEAQENIQQNIESGEQVDATEEVVVVPEESGEKTLPPPFAEDNNQELIANLHKNMNNNTNQSAINEEILLKEDEILLTPTPLSDQLLANQMEIPPIPNIETENQEEQTAQEQPNYEEGQEIVEEGNNSQDIEDEKDTKKMQYTLEEIERLQKLIESKNYKRKNLLLKKKLEKMEEPQDLDKILKENNIDLPLISKDELSDLYQFKSKNNYKNIHDCFMKNLDPTQNWEVENVLYNHLTEDTLNEFVFLDPEKCKYDTQRPPSENSTFYALSFQAKKKFKVQISFNSFGLPKQLNETQIQEKIDTKKKEMDKQLDSKLPVRNLNKYKFDHKLLKEINRHAISNLLGGILYSYGKIRIEGVPDEKVNASMLLTASPSRLGFPRGFLWDEGFHQQIICRWNIELCMTMMTTWFETIQDNGWIPREQARGDELESNFQQKSFLYQSEVEANPPSMMMAIEYLAFKGIANTTTKEDRTVISRFLYMTQPKLKRWLNWMISKHVNNDTNDCSPQESILLKWNCKPHQCKGNYLASGLDDYPRHGSYSQHAVGHVDLHSWMFYFARTVNFIDNLFKKTDESIIKLEKALYFETAKYLDPNSGLFKDLYAHNYPKDKKKEVKFQNTLGYINLFPLIFGILPHNSTEFQKSLDFAASWEDIWTQFGLRSMSQKDPMFKSGDKYWTEPIWMPANFIFLRSLKIYYSGKSNDAKLMYEALRENLIENIAQSWQSTHNFWENYDSFNGKGKGFPSFTGWTALIAMIIAENF